jgi:subtilisin family serine protease
VLVGVLALGALVLVGSVTGATRPVTKAQAVSADDRALGVRDPASRTGTARVVVQLTQPSVAAAITTGAATAAEQRSAAQTALSQQGQVLGQVAALGGREVASLHKALNAVVVEIDKSKLRQVAALAGVRSVNPIRTYELDLSETVPYIGGAALQQAGVTGKGVKVAVLDSGIDYTHVTMGGDGTAASYEAAYGTSTADPRTTTRDGLFPTDKVYEGWDFVGEVWPNGPEQDDPDPIDCGPEAIGGNCDSGHGTHVADIIAGTGSVADGLGQGVAPDAKLLAVKVCSAVSSACSGLALLQGIEFSLDPNRDGDLSDAVDVINLSLGSSYGQREDDVSAALEGAVKAGVVVVASAGNSADRPYITGTPAASPSLISVAQTQVPSAKLYLITAGGTTVGGSLQSWSPTPAGALSGTLQYGEGTNRLGCTAFTAGAFAGKIALLDRGACAVSIKMSTAAAAGAVAVIVANNASQAPGDLPPDFAFGGATSFAPTFTLTRVDGTALKAKAGQVATIDPSSAVSLVGNMVASSSRGPSYSYQAIKPEIGAPGASLSAEAGTGTGVTAFGGTSGAAPMVAGAAALVLSARSNLSPIEVKALLMNTADDKIGLNPLGQPGVLAPISRIGAGEVRVDKANASGTAAWVERDNGAALSFGYTALSDTVRLRREVTVRNYGAFARTYAITPTFRYADDAASGAVRISAPSSVTVPGRKGTATFTVDAWVDPSRLPAWGFSPLAGGIWGGDGYRLQGNEFDGYLVIDAGPGNRVHLPWHVLPHRSADVRMANTKLLLRQGAGRVGIANASRVQAGGVNVFSLTGVSPRIPRGELPRAGDNFAVVDIQSVGVRGYPGEDYVEFAIDTFDRRSHPNYPAEFDIYIDADGDGTDDYVVYNSELGAFASTGQNVTNVFDLKTGTGGPVYYTAVDLNSGNVILPMALSLIGNPDRMTFSVYAFDNYFTGNLTDAVEGMTHTLSKPKYRLAGGLDSFVLPPSGVDTLRVESVPGGAAASPSDKGLLFMYLDQKESDVSDYSRYEAEALLISP